MYKKVIFVFLVCAVFTTVHAQIVRTEPAFPTESDSIRVIFDASKGNAGLANYTGDIWAHTGVITNLSAGPTDWRYVIAAWSVNTNKVKLNSLGNNLWELKIGPSIRSFYSVPTAEKILRIAFVFRDATGSKQGKSADLTDIFADVYEAGLNINFVKPDKEFLAVDAGSAIDIQVAATSADSIILFQDNVRIARSTGNSLTYGLITVQAGYHVVDVKAYGRGSTATDTFSYLIKGAGTVAELPAGLKDGINYLSDHSVVLVLFAPQKEFVFVIGDFNNWAVDVSYQMNKTPDGQRYWLQMDSLIPLKEYQFQYLVDGEIRIADPYSDKISDPWNDGFIDQVTYPGLIAYPQGKTSQAVSVMQTAQQRYSWKLAGFVAPPNQKLVIYELLVRDFLVAHSFKALTDTLSYLKSLGINAIELMPVSEFEGNDSWGYNPSFYFAVDKYYGPKETFKAFVDSAHQMGIAVIMDMVLNHSYGQSPLVRLYWDAQNSRPAANNPWYNMQSPNTDYSWGYDFNHESIATQRFVDSVNTFWLKEYHVDGFRFDFTKGFTNTPGNGSAYDAKRIAILKRITDKIRIANPSAIVILEHFAANTEEKELADYGMLIWGNSNSNYRSASSGWYSGGSWDFSGVSYQQKEWTQPNLVGYMESHDEERLMYECVNYGNTQNPAYNIKSLPLALKRMELAANFFIPVPGPKMIWMFGELGYDFSINYNGRVGRKPIQWSYLGDNGRKRLNQVYSSLNLLKANNDLFSTSDYQISFQDTIKRISLNHSSMNATILGNFGVRSSMANPQFQHTGWWYEYWSGDSLQVSDVNVRLSFQPGEYRFYTDLKLSRPNIISGIEEREPQQTGVGAISVYPNPANDWLYIAASGSIKGKVTLRVFDLQGKLIWVKTDFPMGENESTRLNVSVIEPGVYFVELQSGDGRSVAKWIKGKKS